MGRYVLRRLLIAIPVLFGITLITFFMANLMPGNYVDTLIPPQQREMKGQMDPEILEQLMRKYGLDQPIYVRYLKWLKELVLHGNMGYDYRTGEPVLEEMLQKLPATLQLTVGAMAFSLVVGVLLGILSAVYQYSWFDQLMTFLSFIWISTPAFVFALGALYLFGFRIPLFPLGGRTDVGTGENPTLWTYLHHMALPVTVLGLGGVAGYLRYARSSLLETLHQDYVTVARAKGLREKVVYLRHALKNALLPLITLMGLRLPALIGGSFIIESIFVWPGIGFLSMGGIRQRIYPLIMAMNLITSTLVLLSNLATDIAYAWADPRIRYD